MKTAVEWFSTLDAGMPDSDLAAISIPKIREIQADALQFAYDELAKDRPLIAAGVINGTISTLRHDIDPPTDVLPCPKARKPW